MAVSNLSYKSTAAQEARLTLVLLLVGLLLLPATIYLIGQWLFGDYGGAGLTDFFERIYRGILAGDGVVWFLFLSPYLGWQVIRLTAWLYRRTSTGTADRPS